MEPAAPGNGRGAEDLQFVRLGAYRAVLLVDVPVSGRGPAAPKPH
jgi:hypothetical protein